jgi:hypothetical protein
MLLALDLRQNQFFSRLDNRHLIAKDGEFRGLKPAARRATAQNYSAR